VFLHQSSLTVDSNSRNAVSFSSVRTLLRGPLRNQTHRELVYRPLQFQKRSQLFIRTHNVTLSVAAMRVSNPDCSPLGINGGNEHKLQLRFLRLSAMISQYFTRSDSAIFVLHTTMTK